MVIVQILLAYLLTIWGSKKIINSAYLKIVKRLANDGYLLTNTLVPLGSGENVKNSEVNDDNTLKLNKFKDMHKLIEKIPVINLINAINIAVIMHDSEESMISNMHRLEQLRRMTKKEKEEFAKNPTGFNAFTLAFLHEVKLKDAITIELADGSIIKYIKIENEVEILEKKGKAVYYKDSECIDIVLDFEEKVINAFKETFSNINFNDEENTISLENPLNLDESLSLEEYAKIMGEYNNDNGNDSEDEKIKIKIKKL